MVRCECGGIEMQETIQKRFNTGGEDWRITEEFAKAVSVPMKEILTVIKTMFHPRCKFTLMVRDPDHNHNFFISDDDMAEVVLKMKAHMSGEDTSIGNPKKRSVQ